MDYGLQSDLRDLLKALTELAKATTALVKKQTNNTGE